jgi:TRAP-type mannitol/chloroaromatic compound transport system permease large subunit
MMAALFIAYIWLRCRMNPALGPVLPEERAGSPAPKSCLLWAGALPLGIFLVMMVPFVLGYTRLVESSVIGALAAVGVAAGSRGGMTLDGVGNRTRRR